MEGGISVHFKSLKTIVLVLQQIFLKLRLSQKKFASET
jgi:hypothetical protein